MSADVDARVALVLFGLEAVGTAPCGVDYDDCGESAWPVSQHGVEERPVYCAWCARGADGTCLEALGDGGDGDHLMPGLAFGHNTHDLRPVDRYSTDVSCAWSVIDDMHIRGYRYRLLQIADGKWRAVFISTRGLAEAFPAVGDSMPMATALAALSAMDNRP